MQCLRFLGDVVMSDVGLYAWPIAVACALLLLALAVVHGIFVAAAAAGRLSGQQARHRPDLFVKLFTFLRCRCVTYCAPSQRNEALRVQPNNDGVEAATQSRSSDKANVLISDLCGTDVRKAEAALKAGQSASEELDAVLRHAHEGGDEAMLRVEEAVERAVAGRDEIEDALNDDDTDVTEDTIGFLNVGLKGTAEVTHESLALKATDLIEIKNGATVLFEAAVADEERARGALREMDALINSAQVQNEEAEETARDEDELDALEELLYPELEDFDEDDRKLYVIALHAETKLAAAKASKVDYSDGSDDEDLDDETSTTAPAIAEAIEKLRLLTEKQFSNDNNRLGNIDQNVLLLLNLCTLIHKDCHHHSGVCGVDSMLRGAGFHSAYRSSEALGGHSSSATGSFANQQLMQIIERNRIKKAAAALVPDGVPSVAPVNEAEASPNPPVHESAAESAPTLQPASPPDPAQLPHAASAPLATVLATNPAATAAAGGSSRSSSRISSSLSIAAGDAGVAAADVAAAGAGAAATTAATTAAATAPVIVPSPGSAEPQFEELVAAVGTMLSENNSKTQESQAQLASVCREILVLLRNGAASQPAPSPAPVEEVTQGSRVDRMEPSTASVRAPPSTGADQIQFQELVIAVSSLMEANSNESRTQHAQLEHQYKEIMTLLQSLSNPTGERRRREDDEPLQESGTGPEAIVEKAIRHLRKRHATVQESELSHGSVTGTTNDAKAIDVQRERTVSENREDRARKFIGLLSRVTYVDSYLARLRKSTAFQEAVLRRNSEKQSSSTTTTGESIAASSRTTGDFQAMLSIIKSKKTYKKWVDNSRWNAALKRAKANTKFDANALMNKMMAESEAKRRPEKEYTDSPPDLRKLDLRASIAEGNGPREIAIECDYQFKLDLQLEEDDGATIDDAGDEEEMGIAATATVHKLLSGTWTLVPDDQKGTPTVASFHSTDIRIEVDNGTIRGTYRDGKGELFQPSVPGFSVPGNSAGTPTVERLALHWKEDPALHVSPSVEGEWAFTPTVNVPVPKLGRLCGKSGLSIKVKEMKNGSNEKLFLIDGTFDVPSGIITGKYDPIQRIAECKWDTDEASEQGKLRLTLKGDSNLVAEWQHYIRDERETAEFARSADIDKGPHREGSMVVIADDKNEHELQITWNQTVPPDTDLFGPRRSENRRFRRSEQEISKLELEKEKHREERRRYAEQKKAERQAAQVAARIQQRQEALARIPPDKIGNSSDTLVLTLSGVLPDGDRNVLATEVRSP